MSVTMKDSGVEWIGKIPVNWGILKLKNFVTINNGKDNAIKDGIYPVYGSGGVFGYTDNYLYDGESVLLGRKGTIDSPKYINEKFWSVDTSFYTTAKNDTIMKYFYYIAQSIDYSFYKSGSAVPSMTQSALSEIYLPNPPKHKQHDIVFFLDQKVSHIDNIISKTKESIEEYKKYKQSLITETVTKGLNPDVKMKDSGIEWIGEVPEHWDVMAQKYIMGKSKVICEMYNGENILSLTRGGVIIRDLENPSGKMPTTFDGYQFVYPGNLLLCLFDIDVTPRCVGLIKDIGLTSPAYSQFIVKKGYHVNYYNLLLEMIDDIKAFLHLSKNLRSSFTETDFGAIKTIVPPLDEQVEIALFVETKKKEIDDFILKKDNFISELEVYKKSFIYEVVTGKKEVN